MPVDAPPAEDGAAEDRARDPASLRLLLTEAVPPTMPPASLVFLRAAAETAAKDGSAIDLAAALRLSPRQLSRALARARLPTGVRLLIWLRVLVAAKVLDQPGATVEMASKRSGYSAPSALRRAVRKITAFSPAELVAGGAFATASELFRAELAGAYVHSPPCVRTP
jgi:transcriptional regulator GlxA family with amidase domain